MSLHISIAPDISGFLEPVAAEGVIFECEVDNVLDHTQCQVIVAFEVGENLRLVISCVSHREPLMDRSIARTLCPYFFYPC